MTFTTLWSHPQSDPTRQSNCSFSFWTFKLHFVRCPVYKCKRMSMSTSLWLFCIKEWILDVAPCKLTYLLTLSIIVNNLFSLSLSGIKLMSSKTNNLANINLIKLSWNTHHLQRSSGSTLPYGAESVSGSRVLDCTTLSIVVSLDPSSPLNLYWNGHICCSGSEAEIVFRPAWQRVIVQLGP